MLLASAFLLLFASGEFLYRVVKVKGEITRKWTHFGTGVLTLLFPVMLQSHWSVLILCSAFALILLASLKINFLPSINAIERVSYGSLCYPLAVYLVFLMYSYSQMKGNYTGGMYTGFYMPILILAISDPLAALVGKRYPWKPYRIGATHKTVMGSLSFFLSAVLICLMLISMSGVELNVWRWLFIVLVLALVSTLAEAISGKGLDNLTIPLVTACTWQFILSKVLW